MRASMYAARWGRRLAQKQLLVVDRGWMKMDWLAPLMAFSPVKKAG